MKNNFFIFCNAAVALLALACLIWILNARFAVGDVYPVYSSLRADPLGSMALYESLRNMEGFEVERNFDDLKILIKKNLTKDKPVTAAFFLNERLERFFSGDYFKDITGVAANGVSVITAFQNDFYKFDIKKTRSGNCESGFNKSKKQKNSDSETAINYFGFNLKKIPNNIKSRRALKMTDCFGDADIPFNSGYYFEIENNKWKPVYSIAGKFPVVVKKQIGSGSLTLIAGSYLFSNEALRRQPLSSFILLCLNDNKNIIFDEAHLGVASDKGISYLFVKYKLYGFLLGFLIVFILLLWKNSVLETPVKSKNNEDKRKIFSSGDFQTGLINVLRKHIKPDILLINALEEWKTSLPKNNAAIEKKTVEMENYLKETGVGKNSVETYNKLAEIFNRKN